MEKTRDTRKELKTLRKEVMLCFSKTPPSKKFGPMVMMAMVGLHMVENKIHKSFNTEERRRSTNDFRRGKKTIESKIRNFRKHNSGDSKNHGEKFRRAMS